MVQTISMLQDTAARARPSGLACRRVLRSSGKIMQIRTNPMEPNVYRVNRRKTTSGACNLGAMTTNPVRLRTADV